MSDEVVGLHCWHDVIVVFIVLGYNISTYYNCLRFPVSLCLTQTSTTIYVRIVDENDNAPEFPEEEYVTVLSEGPETVGATIATVTAIDPDEGLNGTLRYAITSGNLIQTFLINNITVRHESKCAVVGHTTQHGNVCMICVFRGESLL